MPETDEIRKHIDVLSEFEQLYGEYLVARQNRQLEGRHDWPRREWARRERQLRMLAPRADAAIEASGVSGLALYGPPAIGEPLIADDLASMIFHVEDRGFGVESRDDSLMRAILDRLPSQIAGLEMQLEKAEARRRQGVRLPSLALRWGWLNHPLVAGIAATVIGGGILAAIVALLH